MTLLSKCILAGYGLLQVLFVILLDCHLKKHFRARPAYRAMRRIWIILYAAAAAVPVAATFLPEGDISLLLQRAGNVFLAFDLHIAGLFLLSFFVYRLMTLVFFRKTPAPVLPLWTLILILTVGTIVPAYGLRHAQDTVIHFFKTDLATDRSVLTENRKIRLALIGDLHLDVNSHLQTAQNMVRMINEQEPDVVLVAGDVFTSSYAALRKPEKYAEVLRGIRAPMGVYAVYGNHDVEETLFGGFAVHPVSKAFRTEQIEQFFEDCDFTVLYDEIAEIANGSIQLAGRIDGGKAGDGTKNRLTPAELLKDTDPSKPVLVLEHEPAEYELLREAGADMVLSGHTHEGQIFPGNICIHLIHENGYGQKTLYGMETFVTSGVGTFGPPIRTGTDSEIMIIDVTY